MFIRVLFLLAFFMTSFSWADDVRIQDTLMSKYPSTKILDVRPSELPGIYEVVMEQNIGYTDKEGRYMIFGHLYDLVAQKDISAERLRNIKRINTASLPVQSAIKHVQGNGSNVLYLFTDPECPYCRKLESELALMDDITLYVFLIPTHPKSTALIDLIYCSADPYQTMHDYMISGTPIPSISNCKPNDAVRSYQALATALGVVSTPTLVSQDGRVLTGYAPMNEVASWLAKK